MSNIIYIESNPLGFNSIKKAKELGHHVIFVTSNLNYYKKKQIILDKVDQIIIADDTIDYKSLYNYLKEQINLKNIDAVISLNELHIITATYIAEKLNLPTLNYSSSKNLRNKLTVKNLLSKNKLLYPKYNLLSLDGYEKKLSLEYPFIVKPLNGTGSYGVHIIKNKNELNRYMNQFSEKKFMGRNFYLYSKSVLAEEFIDGTVYSIETLTIKNTHYLLGVTERGIKGPDSLVETKSFFPVTDMINDDFSYFVKKILDTLNINHGFMHIELIFGKNGKFYIIDTNPRLAGGVIPYLIEHAYHIDIHQILIDIYLNKNIHFQETFNNLSVHNYLASLHFTADESKTITNTPNFSKIKKKYNSSLVHIQFNKEVGDLIAYPISNFDRLGHAIIKDDSLITLKKSLHSLEIEINDIIKHV